MQSRYKLSFEDVTTQVKLEEPETISVESLCQSLHFAASRFSVACFATAEERQQ